MQQVRHTRLLAPPWLRCADTQVTRLDLTVAGIASAQQQLEWQHRRQQGTASSSTGSRRQQQQQQGSVAPNLLQHLASRMPQLSQLKLFYNTIVQVGDADAVGGRPLMPQCIWVCAVELCSVVRFVIAAQLQLEQQQLLLQAAVRLLNAAKSQLQLHQVVAPIQPGSAAAAVAMAAAAAAGGGAVARQCRPGLSSSSSQRH